ncbi:polysaccharide biosynthesis/export family protein [Litorimonas taeanensis]|uniref:polysaccharide biosynthesis/export family protein n=1 Tax=Litorimonas taeanensis TaxID=568099 RepID=UPI00147469C3|nr:polysaccharide biosynthesis/export family protein [Litorimonas taeanensis]
MTKPAFITQMSQSVSWLESKLLARVNSLNLKSIVCVLFSFTLLTACSTVNSQSLEGQLDANGNPVSDMFVTEFPEVSLDQVIAQSRNDTFKVGDTAIVSVYNVETLSTDYVVDRAGNIVFPLIGTVKVAGLSTLEVQEALVERYGSQYLRNPSISVKIEARDLGKIVVDGAVEKPGVFELNNVIRLTEAIALAEGVTNDANLKEVFIIRDVNGERLVQSVNFENVRKLGTADPVIIPNDVVYIRDSFSRVAFREFLRTVPLLNTAAILATR